MKRPPRSFSEESRDITNVVVLESDFSERDSEARAAAFAGMSRLKTRGSGARSTPEPCTECVSSFGSSQQSAAQCCF